MKALLLLLSVTFSGIASAQTVGIVFSGGGASGFAHIGVLKALEENDIPIDYITGTSAGALVGAMYASGYSALEIEAIAKSPQFYKLTQGILEDKYKFFLHNADVDSELLSVKFTTDSVAQKFLPTNILNSTPLDLELLYYLGVNPTSTLLNFDSLFIPFRCIASDISTKESVLFKNGDLNMAVRASMTYPFFISPIKVDGRLLYDGGLTNNFPANELINEFDVDYVIGSNVSYNEPPPSEDDLMSQVKNLFSQHSNYVLPCENGILIEPQLENIGTFDFDKITEAIDIGYVTTQLKIDSIKAVVTRRSNKIEMAMRRQFYQSQKIKIEIDKVGTSGVTKEEELYIKRKLVTEKQGVTLDQETLRARYLRLYQNDHFLSFFPTLAATDTNQTLNIQVRREKPLQASFGGHFSTRRVNTGFFKLQYNNFTTAPTTLYANAYFGGFYGSIRLGAKLSLPTKKDSYIEPFYSRSQWDYTNSSDNVFQNPENNSISGPITLAAPTSLIVSESMWGLKYNAEIFGKGKLELSFKSGSNKYNYYQKEIVNFQNDTLDATDILFYSPGIRYFRNSFNRKQFESEGTLFEVTARYVQSIENTLPGSTSFNPISQDNTFRNWAYLNIKYIDYFLSHKNYRMGVFAQGYYAIKPNFHNYTITNLDAERFSPFADSRTEYFRDYRSNEFIGLGMINILTLKDKVDFRLEGYLLQPFRTLIDNEGESELSPYFSNRYFLGSGSIIFHSFVGPVRATMNYYGGQESSLSFQVSYGYVIFNERSTKD
ncbi:MAG: patatin-like phospholipase family protein [Crocinitomicaceae bacterium]